MMVDVITVEPMLPRNTIVNTIGEKLFISGGGIMMRRKFARN